jgi:hypothetical protein
VLEAEESGEDSEAENPFAALKALRQDDEGDT